MVIFSPRAQPMTKKAWQKAAGKLPGFGGQRTGPGGKVLDSQHYVNGPPTESYIDNLKDDVLYLTAWNYAGFTNDFVAWSNLLYLSKITNRVPILPPLAPFETHLGSGGITINYSEVFDLPRLSKSLGIPILEWSEVKQARYGHPLHPTDRNPHPGDDEPIACWSVWQAFDKSGAPFDQVMPSFLHLEPKYVPVPEHVKLHKTKPDPHCSFSGLSSLITPGPEKRPIPADTQLACFDILYWTSEKQSWEWEAKSAVWDLVAKNSHWTKNVEDLTILYLRNVLGVAKNVRVPPFISVHIRRRDFVDQCEGIDEKDCFAPLSAYARRIKQVQSDLTQMHGFDSSLSHVTHVIVTGDETDDVWWAKIRAMGWKTTRQWKSEIDEKHGKWYSTIIDAAIQSKGAGFVGTAGSTMSLVAARRVEDWNRGPTRMVMWGAPGADDDE